MLSTREPYPSDVANDEWVLVVPYLMLLPEEAGQRSHFLRAVFNGLLQMGSEQSLFEKAASMASHASIRTAQLYDRHNDEINLDEVERIGIQERSADLA